MPRPPRSRRFQRDRTRYGRRAAILRAQTWRIGDQADMQRFLARKGYLHLHWRRCGDAFCWHVMYAERSRLCETPACVIIPFRIPNPT